MPRQKDLKRRVRARMQKTGESYTAARARILARPPREGPARPAPELPRVTRDLGELAGMSDQAVSARTGRTWRQWTAVLDEHDAARLPHKEIARLLADAFELPSWWSQTVAVGYERIRGLRKIGQKRSGTFEVSKSRTLPVSLASLYAAFGARRRKAWMGAASWKVRKASPRRSLRVTWEDGTPLELTFRDRGPGKSQVQLQHGGLPDERSAERVRAAWGARLDALAAHLFRG